MSNQDDKNIYNIKHQNKQGLGQDKQEQKSDLNNFQIQQIKSIIQQEQQELKQYISDQIQEMHVEIIRQFQIQQNLAQQQDNECQKRQLKLHQIDILECLKTKESQNPQSLKKRDNQKKLLLAGSIQKIDYYIEEQKLYTH
ncbi:hypothetical protein PPERSA_00509 [Pseudocohnilembus persalinus]|uniref:Uncharacterized protein n=1 Tax=Pseudocohnilembus persalinus TaxID=266149 RepID=A0A0V0QHW8_PSEPJ|nr:hypothetical protein PPERSA_00509 [Pseudocohnilembus persalinus]|eukprot:KRX01799.1 hypothetical protein PPERSA_00509 [Pseudocohnilembus persalinus]